MTEMKQPEALQLAQFFESMKKSSHRWHDGAPVHEKAAAELRRLHDENEQFRTELVAEAARTAEATLRANQMTEQHRMQCNMREQGWQPIESAPKDGTWLILWRAPAQEFDGWTCDPMVIARWHEDEDGDAEWTWPDEPFDPFTDHGIDRANAEVERGASWGADTFTAWMPLPKPPAM